MGGLLAAITAVCSLAALFLEAWAQNAPQRKKEKIDEEIQEGREALVDGDAALVTARLGRVLDEASDSDAGGKGGTAQEGGAGAAQRLAAFGISTGKAPGTGGKVPE